jgi:hypothetical protein
MRGQGWSGPLQGQTLFSAGTPVAAVARNPNHLNLFAVGQDGGVHTAWWDINGGWQGWSGPLQGQTLFSAGAPVAVVSLGPCQLSLFGVGNDGAVHTALLGPEDRDSRSAWL